MQNTRRRVMAAAAIAAAVAGGAAAGAVIAAPSPSSAQEVTDEATTTTVAPDATNDAVGDDAEGCRGGPGGPGHGFLGLGVAAEAIGIEEADLRAALEDGASIASVAEDNGVDPATVVDAMVAAATAEIDEKVASGDLDADRAAELKADLEARVTEAVEQEGLPPHGHHD